LTFLSIIRDCKTDFLAISYVQLGVVFGSLNNYKASIPCYYKAIPILSEQKKYRTLADVFVNLAADYVSVNKIDSAYYYYSKSDSIYHAQGRRVSSAYAKGNIGILLAKDNQLDSALVYLKASHQILLDEEHYQAAISYRLWLSIINQKQRRFDDAFTLANSSLDLAQQQGLKEQIRDSYEQLASIHTSMGEYQKANESLVQYYAYRDSIVNTETITQMANLRTEFEVGQKQAELDVVVQREAYQVANEMVFDGCFFGGFNLARTRLPQF
jgi:two-component system, NtrC family, sensor kinase